MNRVAEQVTSETDAKLAARDEAIRELQERAEEIERVVGIRRDEYHRIWLEVQSSGDEGLLYEWMADHKITRAMIDEWERQDRR